MSLAVETRRDFSVPKAVREKYPEDANSWDQRVAKAQDPNGRGCFTCPSYHPLEEQFTIRYVTDYPIIWETDLAFVVCDKIEGGTTELKAGCQFYGQSSKEREEE